MKWWKYAVAAALGKIIKFIIVVFGVYYIVPFLVEQIPGGFGDMISAYVDRMITSI